MSFGSGRIWIGNIESQVVVAIFFENVGERRLDIAITNFPQEVPLFVFNQISER